MTKQEEMEYRRSCPYDAMGDYSGLFSYPEEKEKPDEDQKEQRIAGKLAESQTSRFKKNGSV